MKQIYASQQPATRLAYIDAQRGIAALLVIWLHASEVFMQLPKAPAGGWLFELAWAVDTGHIGVVLFFAISGFVIPSSLRAQSGKTTRSELKVFFIRRFFRLYPAYWVSVVASGLLGLYMLSPFSAQTLLLNLTMIQGLLGVPDVMGLYWTLRIELLFYGVCVVLFMLRLLHQPRWLAAALFASLLSGLAVAAYRLHPASAGILLDYRPVYGLYLAIMFWGALFRRWNDEQLSSGVNSFSRPLKAILILFPLVLCLSPLVVTIAYNLVPSAYSPNILRLFLPIAIGLGLFVVFSTILKINNRLCTWLGKISYSLYLFHPLVFYPLFVLVRDERLPALNGAHLSTYLLLSVLGSIVLSAAIYYVVEKPAIQLGRKLAGR